jgi:hypothetical protein
MQNAAEHRGSRRKIAAPEAECRRATESSKRHCFDTKIQGLGLTQPVGESPVNADFCPFSSGLKGSRRKQCHKRVNLFIWPWTQFACLQVGRGNAYLTFGSGRPA